MKQFNNIESTAKKGLVAVYVTNGRIDEALRKFRKRVEKYEVLDIYKEKQAYIKPSDKKHQKNRTKKF